MKTHKIKNDDLEKYFDKVKNAIYIDGDLEIDFIGTKKNIKGRPNVSALARQFRVARRTIIRDFQELIRRGQLPPEIFPKWEGYEEDENED